MASYDIIVALAAITITLCAVFSKHIPDTDDAKWMPLMNKNKVISTRDVDVRITSLRDIRHVDPPTYLPETLDINYDIDGKPVSKRMIKTGDHTLVKSQDHFGNYLGVDSKQKREWATYISSDHEAAALIKRDASGNFVIEGSLSHEGNGYYIQPNKLTKRHELHHLQDKLDVGLAANVHGTKRQSGVTNEIELFIVFDYEVFEHWNTLLANEKDSEDELLGKTIEMISEYYGLIINEVDYRFQSLARFGADSEYVRVIMGGLMMSIDRGSTPYKLEEIQMPGTKEINSTQLLYSFRKYAVEELKTIRADCIQLFSGLKFYATTIGVQFVGRVCDDNFKYGIVQDNHHLTVVSTAAHELGHGVNMPHDSSNTNCGEDSYLMRPMLQTLHNHKEPTHIFKFSRCSLESFKTFLTRINRHDRTNCLSERTSYELEMYGHAMWGAEMTLDEQCKQQIADSYFDERATEADLQGNDALICHGVMCKTKEGYLESIRPYMGTSCGDFKMCRYDKCVLRPWNNSQKSAKVFAKK